MNVAFVVHDYDVREGHGRYAVELVTRLARSVDLTLYAANIHDTPPEGLRVVRVPAVRRPSYATILSFPRAFASVCGRHDLIHAQGWSANSPDVVTAHIVLGAWRGAARRASMRRGLGERFLGGWVQRREADLYRNKAGLVIAPSTSVKADLGRHYGRTHDIEVVPHAFQTVSESPVRADARSALRLAPNSFIALYAGDARKGLDVSLEALAMSPGVDLLVVSRSAARGYLHKADELGVQDRVHWIGGLPDLTPAHSAADVLLHPTIYDAFGLVVAESMACGTPAIVSHAAGIAEFIDHRESGWIVAPDDATQCADALTTLREDATLRDDMARKARAIAAKRNWDHVAQETLACYQRAAGNK